MSGSEEETYSVMFSSLRHPARRKILRMLSDRAMTFSQMLEELAIPSSHLTYHLENLGELVLKEKDGKYKLSSFGKASVSMMKGAEEVPNVQSKRFSALDIRWKSLIAVFMIATVLLASMSFMQYSSFNRLSDDYGLLKADFELIKEQNDKLMRLSTAADKAMAIIRNVVQIDASKYQSITLADDKVEERKDLGGVIEEVMRYSLVNPESRIDLTLRFRNSHFSLLQINQLEGLPSFPLVFTQPQPPDALDATRGILARYGATMNDSYLDQVNQLLATANGNQSLGNAKLTITEHENSADVLIQYSNDGTDFAAKSLHLVFQNNILTQFNDDWFLFEIGNTQIKISKEQAIAIAKEGVKQFSWTANGVTVTDFTVLDNPTSATFYPLPKSQKSLTLYPYWYVTLYLDQVYPGNVSMLAVGVWADTGEVTNIQALTQAAL